MIKRLHVYIKQYRFICRSIGKIAKHRFPQLLVRVLDEEQAFCRSVVRYRVQCVMLKHVYLFFPSSFSDVFGCSHRCSAVYRSRRVCVMRTCALDSGVKRASSTFRRSGC